IFNAYRSRFFSSFTQDIPILFKTCVVSLLVAMSGAFLYRGFSYSRLVFVLIFINLIIFLLLGRFIFHRTKGSFIKKGYSVLHALLVGSGENLIRVYDRLVSAQNHNLQIVGYISEHSSDELPLKYAGKLTNLPQIISHSQPCDALIVSFKQNEHHKVLDIIKNIEGKNIDLFYVPDILDMLTSNFHSMEINGVPLLQLKAYILSGWQGLLKRTFDVVVSVASIIVLSPLFFVIAFLIKVTSKGPIFYAQPRVGLDGREFMMLKFRSMRTDAEADSGPVWASQKDPRVTPVGKILRRSSLDELPQLFNVLASDMSLVGPRPERRHFVEQFQEYIPKYIERHRVRSGMTGWAQVNGLRGQSPVEERTRYDLYYIENWSLWFDLKIIVMTFMEIIRGENAY
ncbi:MAG: undecaprenyl-phosphate glucose phosphotransferase, partial [Calditrichae bacterium]|nr:undecaprenyl-phosphate glucose phosphotransferase [Calditrichia bacterium]